MFFENTPQGIVLRIRLQPNSSCCRVSGIFTSADGNDFLKVNVISIPEKGKANRELISWLSKELKRAKSDFQIVSGELDRCKKILITADFEDMMPKLQALAEKE